MHGIDAGHLARRIARAGARKGYAEPESRVEGRGLTGYSLPPLERSTPWSAASSGHRVTGRHDALHHAVALVYERTSARTASRLLVRAPGHLWRAAPTHRPRRLW